MSFELNNVFLIRLQIYSRTLSNSPPPQWQTSSPCRSHSATIIFAKCGAELFPTHDLNDCVMMTVESVLNLLNDDYSFPLSLYSPSQSSLRPTKCVGMVTFLLLSALQASLCLLSPTKLSPIPVVERGDS